MISSFLVALREGLEAALIVGIVLASLARSGRSRLARYVWAGVGLAVGLSLAVGLALELWHVNQEGFEGILLLTSAFFVVTVIVWMGRAAKHLKKDIEAKVDSYADRSGVAAGLGLAAFVFLMVVREGAELALILRAVEMSASGLAVWTGTLAGLAAATAVGSMFFHGTLKIPLGRFFRVTSWILVIVAIQLAIMGVHELSESGWIPASQQEMALIGPIVRNEVFFFAAILGAAAVLVLREYLSIARSAEGAARKSAGWMIAAGSTFVVVLLILTADFVYARTNAGPPESQFLNVDNGAVRVPVDGLGDGALHFFHALVDGTSQSFMVMRKSDGNWLATLDGCLICGRHGYRQEGPMVVCRNCGAEIPMSTMGEAGGCNPIPLPSRLENGELVVQTSDLSQHIEVYKP